MRSWLSHIHQVDSRLYHGTWFREIRCTCSSTPWGTCIRKHQLLDSWGPHPLCLYSHRSSVFHHVEVGLGISGIRWRLVVFWGVLLGQVGWSMSWSWGLWRASDSYWFWYDHVILLLVVLGDYPHCHLGYASFCLCPQSPDILWSSGSSWCWTWPWSNWLSLDCTALCLFFNLNRSEDTNT